MIKTDKKPEQYAPLVLAYIGDAIYEAYVRSRVIEENPDMPAYKLHNKSVKYVKAHAQANSIHAMTEMLTEEEMQNHRQPQRMQPLLTIVMLQVLKR